MPEVHAIVHRVKRAVVAFFNIIDPRECIRTVFPLRFNKTHIIHLRWKCSFHMEVGRIPRGKPIQNQRRPLNLTPHINFRTIAVNIRLPRIPPFDG